MEEAPARREANPGDGRIRATGDRVAGRWSTQGAQDRPKQRRAANRESWGVLGSSDVYCRLCEGMGLPAANCEHQASEKARAHAATLPLGRRHNQRLGRGRPPTCAPLHTESRTLMFAGAVSGSPCWPRVTRRHRPVEPARVRPPHRLTSKPAAHRQLQGDVVDRQAALGDRGTLGAASTTSSG